MSLSARRCGTGVWRRGIGQEMRAPPLGHRGPQDVRGSRMSEARPGTSRATPQPWPHTKFRTKLPIHTPRAAGFSPCGDAFPTPLTPRKGNLQVRVVSTKLCGSHMQEPDPPVKANGHEMGSGQRRRGHELDGPTRKRPVQPVAEPLGRLVPQKMATPLKTSSPQRA